MFKVRFINARGEKVERSFDSPYICRCFVQKLKRSKKCRIISCPTMR